MKTQQCVSSSKVLIYCFSLKKKKINIPMFPFQWNSGISLEPWAQWQCWPRKALQSIAVVSRTRRSQVTTCTFPLIFILARVFPSRAQTSEQIISPSLMCLDFLICALCVFDIGLFLLLFGIFVVNNPSLHILFSYSFLAIFIFISPGQAASRRMRPTSLPIWRPSLHCRRREHQGRRLESRLRHGGARSDPSKPLSSPRWGAHCGDC